MVYTPTLADKQWPIGPAAPPASPALPVTVAAGASLDVELHFAWSGDAYAGLTIGGYRFVLTLVPPAAP